MKNFFLMLFLIVFAGEVFSQNLIVDTPMEYPYGININMDTRVKGGWAREFTLSYGGKGHMFSFGTFAEANRLIYGYIGGNNTNNNTNYANPWMVFLPNGNAGIGVVAPKSKLDVNGTIRAKEILIEATGWADFVFAEGYNLPALSVVENHIKSYKHLPDIPSETEIKENGISVSEMQAKLLQKIEELTLYIIQQDKKIEKQTEQINELQQIIRKQ